MFSAEVQLAEQAQADVEGVVPLLHKSYLCQTFISLCAVALDSVCTLEAYAGVTIVLLTRARIAMQEALNLKAPCMQI